MASGLKDIKGTFPQASVGHFILRYEIVDSIDIAAAVAITPSAGGNPTGPSGASTTPKEEGSPTGR
jgi:hypothetical protein